MSTQKSSPGGPLLSASPHLLSTEGSPSPSPTPSSQASSGRSGRANREYDCIEHPKDSPFVVAVTADKNAKKRRKMEDGHAYFYDFNHVKGQGLFAIFDGHAGAAASEWCQSNYHQVLMRLLDMNNAKPKSEKLPIQDILNRSFLEADEHLVQKNNIYSGCTAAVALYKPKKCHSHRHGHVAESHHHHHLGRLYCANVGDARIILCRSGQAIRLTYDHKGSDKKEAHRISNAGGIIAHDRVSGVLAVTRALGDEEMKEFVIGAPYTTKIEIVEDDEFLINACDGLWDVVTDQEAVELVRDMKNPLQASEFLVNYAMENGSTDNLSVMVIRFIREELDAQKTTEKKDTDLNESVSEAQPEAIDTASSNTKSSVPPTAVTADEKV